MKKRKNKFIEFFMAELLKERKAIFIKLIPKMKFFSWGLIFILVIISLSGCQKKQILPSINKSTPEQLNNSSQNNVVPENNNAAESQTALISEGIKLPVAIMLDNFIDSRPVSGINSASIIYESPAEADITRFLAIFNQDALPDKIGPVRSARPYFVRWAEEYGALYIHAGGSDQALKTIKNDQKEDKIYDLNEISGDGAYFWRDHNRVAPSNLYTSGEFIKKAIENRNLPEKIKTNFSGWKFSNDINLTSQESSEFIKINYLDPVAWKFDSKTDFYLRFSIDSKTGTLNPFVDADGTQIKTKNLIIQKTEINILDEVGRREITTIGDGEAMIFQKGKLTKGKWQRGDSQESTRFYDTFDKEIEFLPGSVWVEVVSPRHKLVY
ncbi:MAG: DUF3048 domain-containing protein [Patescibacteria group bacterium]